MAKTKPSRSKRAKGKLTKVKRARSAASVKAAPKRPATEFHLFSELPSELRILIWETAFPELTKPSRVFELNVDRYHTRVARHYGTGDNDPFKGEANMAVYRFEGRRPLKSQTLPFRTLNAINRETRDILQKTLPDSFGFEACAWLGAEYQTYFDEDTFSGARARARFRKETDIIYLAQEPGIPARFTLLLNAEFQDTVQNLGWANWNVPISPHDGYMIKWLKQFPNLRRFYFGSDPTMLHLDARAVYIHKTLERLCKLQGCDQHGGYRFPTMDMAKAGLGPSIDGMLHHLRMKMCPQGLALLPILKITDLLCSKCVHGY